MPHAESSDQRGDRHVAVADVQKQGQELEELAGLSRFVTVWVGFACALCFEVCLSSASGVP
jgi:hypothetical protein